jgi:secondary thiamine-phosphate synthase enzyme
MAVCERSFQVKTDARIQIIDITPQIKKIVSSGPVKEGIAAIFSPHTTTGMIINENESRLVKDLEKSIREFISWDEPYLHNQIDDNAPSHIVCSFLGSSVLVPVDQTDVSLGTWQSVFLVELDGPRSRQVRVKIIGD